ncbi:hypothetical protein E2562_013810 [Oryza meyeriana var. granulata]|uniref:Oxidation resistance protein 1 n=1 Tax=Oryza meyeriana var. granulata TaxID=110450 RepID=A0A6G1F8D6_9ORYZ|nr:hypothetical protein E2562_013810 [Oryza meyeriana var. granulata]KAF0933063.1 hypothetical protein E2562_013810 [Oryza meyeriana var. granulata]
MGYLPSSLGSKAAHFVSDLTTVILNPISEREPSSPLPEVDKGEEKSEGDKDSEQNSDTPDGPDTSSFRAFLISFLSSSGSNNESMEIIPDQNGELGYPTLTPMGKSKKGKSGLLSRGKHSIGKVINKAARIGGFKQPKIDREVVDHVESVSPVLELEESKEVASFINLPAMSEPSVLLSEVMRSNLYASFPVLAKGMNWVLLYSTWRHGISLSTLYRRSMLCPGYSLLIVGDKEGAVFGGLVEAPLQPTSAKKYQGSNSCFVFTNLHSNPSIYRPTGNMEYLLWFHGLCIRTSKTAKIFCSTCPCDYFCPFITVQYITIAYFYKNSDGSSCCICYC